MLQRLFFLAKDRAANTAVEFALLAPVLCTLLVGMVVFATALFQYASLTEGVRTGARQLASSLSDSSAYSDAVSAVETAAPALVAPASQAHCSTTTELCITMTVGTSSASCSSNTSCPLAGGTPAVVSATYPCKVVVFGYNFIPNCQLKASSTEMTE